MFNYNKSETDGIGIKQQKPFSDNTLSLNYKRRAGNNGWRAGLVLPKNTLYFTTFLSKQSQIGLTGHDSK